MKHDKIIGGIVLIGIGLIILLANLGYLNWSIFYNIIDLWPLILIAIGVNIMFKRKTIVSVISWIVFFTIFIGYGIFYQGVYNNSINERDQFNIRDNPQVVTGQLNIKLGGTVLDINSTNTSLIDGIYDGSNYKSETRYTHNNSHAIVSIENISGRLRFLNRKNISSSFNLNEDVIWDIRGDVGAVKGTLDFSNLKISNLDVSMGAGDLNIIFGDKYVETKAQIDFGASNLDIYLSDRLGAKIKIKGALNNTNLKNKGWHRVDDYYITPGYEEAESKLILDINAGVANISIHR